jgi:hypothetical protein
MAATDAVNFRCVVRTIFSRVRGGIIRQIARIAFFIIFRNKSAARPVWISDTIVQFIIIGGTGKMKRLRSYFVSVTIIGVAFATGCLRSNLFAQPGGGGAIVAIEEGAGPAVSKGGEKAGTGVGNKKYINQTKSAKGGGAKVAKGKAPALPGQLRSPEPRPYNGSVLGDKYTFLNYEVISAAKPIYRRQAKQSGASGLVQVEVLIDENGDVLTAKARTGNKLLWDEAEGAALASKFNRPTDNGRPARAMGFLVYRFGKSDDDDDEP